MIFTFADFVGTTGVVLLISTYFLLIHGKIQSNSLKYSVLNLSAALLVTYSLLHTWNTASFLIEVFWIAISIYGISKYFWSNKDIK